MLILGIDYGRKKIGLAIADGPLAEPLKILRYEDTSRRSKDQKILSDRIGKIVRELGVEKIVIGVPEGEMAKETREFGEALEDNLKIPVVFQDETLTTNQAQRQAIEAGINRKKRKQMEDAYSASLILQGYLDSQS